MRRRNEEGERGTYIKSAPPGTTSPERYFPRTVPEVMGTQRRRPYGPGPISSGGETAQVRVKRWVRVGGGRRDSIFCFFLFELGWVGFVLGSVG